jgi:hypothetical protein
MSESGQKIPMSATPDPTQFLIAEYEFARDNRNHADASAWEMTSIVWGAQTLLLGFVLEAVSNRDAQPLIMLIAVLGLVMTVFNYVVMTARNRVCNLMNKICLLIEDRPEMVFKPQSYLNRFYRPRIQTVAFRIVNSLFILVWLAVFYAAGRLFFYHNSPSLSHISWL